MRLHSLLPLLVTFLVLAINSIVYAQANLSVGTDEITINENGSYDFLIPADLDTIIWPVIDLELRGGDGGRAKLDRSFSGGLKVPGGQGAEVNIVFQLGRSTNRLRPGGTLRFIVGGAGQNCGTGTQCGVGGQGGVGYGYVVSKRQHANDGGIVDTVIRRGRLGADAGAKQRYQQQGEEKE